MMDTTHDAQIVKVKAYEQREGETPKAYAAFCVYRDLGVNRTIDTAYCIVSGIPTGSKQAPSHFRDWAASNEWVKRSGDYDRDLESARRSDLMDADRTAYMASLEDYRKQLQTIGQAGLNFSAQWLYVSQAMLTPIVNKVKAGQTLTRQEIQDFLALQKPMKSCMDNSDIASRMTGDAMHFSSLMEHLKDAAPADR
jgi:hypothetical protein